MRSISRPYQSSSCSTSHRRGHCDAAHDGVGSVLQLRQQGPRLPGLSRGGGPFLSRTDMACKAAQGQVLREVLSRVDRTKLDQTDDRNFYDMPKLVKHVDEGFLAQVTELYRQRIPKGGAVLDLCSSWVSHLPPDVEYSRVAGHGLNAAELARNDRLDSFFVRDLNKQPDGWAFPDQTFDAVVCCVSVQYLTQPEKVLAEIFRVLKPGGVCIFTFSNRMFYHKAIAAWRDSPDYAHCQLVKQYFQSVEGFSPPEVLKKVTRPDGSSPLSGSGGGLWGMLASLGFRGSSDPFFAVLANRTS